jgi:hypothetical protein
VTKLFAAAQIPKVAVSRQRETIRIKTHTGALHQELVDLTPIGIDVDHLFAETVRVNLAVDAYEHPFIRVHGDTPFITGMMWFYDKRLLWAVVKFERVLQGDGVERYAQNFIEKD